MRINEKNTVDYGDLNAGDCFKAWGKLYIKSAFEQGATALKDGEARCNMCGIQVTPVNAEVQIID